MINQTDLYANFSQYAEMRLQAQEHTDESLNTVAKQFEALFIQMMLKSMRDSVPEGGVFNSDQTRMYRDMMDKQLSVNIASGRGIGLAAVIVRQLAQQQSDDTRHATTSPLSSSKLRQNSSLNSDPIHSGHEATVGPNPHQDANDWDSGETFVRTIWPHAVKAAEQLGVKPEVLVAQSVLETGWGEHVRRGADGSNSYSLFGIKADQRWQGDRVSVSTLEYREGAMQREKAEFRAYGCVAEAFDDYVEFIQTSPRYQSVLQQSSKQYLEALHQAGYATDPEYVDKIQRIQHSELLNKRLGGLKNHINPPLS